MTKPFKKRLKGNWTQGKRYKGDGFERQFSKREIKQLLAEEEEGYLDRHHKGARSRNEKARLEYRVDWYERSLAQDRHGDQWANYMRSGLKEAKAALKKFEMKERDDE